MDGLATAVKEEKRDDVWASQMETELWTSYAAETNLPRGALKSVECRSSKCDLQLQLYPEHSPQATIERQMAINHWIAANQSCGYTITSAPGSAQAPGAMRIFLDCKD